MTLSSPLCHTAWPDLAGKPAELGTAGRIRPATGGHPGPPGAATRAPYGGRGTKLGPEGERAHIGVPRSYRGYLLRSNCGKDNDNEPAAAARTDQAGAPGRRPEHSGPRADVLEDLEQGCLQDAERSRHRPGRRDRRPGRRRSRLTGTQTTLNQTHSR